MFPLALRVELRLGGEWVDITGDVRTSEDVAISRGRQDESSEADHSKCSFRLNNRHGRYTPRNPASPHYGQLGRNTPVRVGVDMDGRTRWRFAGEVSEWPARWDVSDTDVWIDVEAAGVMRRLGQGAGSLGSALFRRIMASGPDAYWPLTDGEDARQGNPAAGSNAMRAVSNVGHLFARQPEWGRGELAPWLPNVVQSRRSQARISGAPPQTSTLGLSVDWARSGLGGTDSVFIALNGEATNASPIHTFFLTWDPVPGTVGAGLQTFQTSGFSQSMLDTSDRPDLFGPAPHHYRMRLADDGTGAVAWSVWIDGVEEMSGSTAVAIRPSYQLGYDMNVQDGDEYDVSTFGHIAVWFADPPEPAAVHDAMLGHRREPAGRRVERVCSEEGIAFSAHGDLDDTQLVGPQYPEPLLDTLRTAAQVDGGVLLESRDSAGLLYRTNRSRYNQGTVTA